MRYTAKCMKTRCPLEGRVIYGAKISWGNGSSLGNIFGLYKTRHILLSNSANCTVLRAVVLTQYRRVTDRQTDGTAVASTALAMTCNASIAARCKNEPPFPHKIAPPMGIWTKPNTRFFGLIRTHNSSGISIGSAFFLLSSVQNVPIQYLNRFAGLTTVTDRPTYTIRFVIIGRVYVHSTAMRPSSCSSSSSSSSSNSDIYKARQQSQFNRKRRHSL